MKKIICLFLFLCSAFIVQAQQVNVDSLINILNTQELTFDEKSELYKKICKIYINTDPKQLMIYAKKGLEFAEKENNNVIIAKFNEFVGVAYIYKASYDTALVFFEKALDIAEKVKQIEQQASVHKYIGILYGRQGKYVIALDYFLKSLSIFENLNNKHECANLYNNIGTIHRGLKNDDRAIFYKEKAKE